MKVHNCLIFYATKSNLSVLRFTYLQLKVTYQMRWWKPCVLSLTSVTSLDMIYMTLTVLWLWMMLFSAFTSTVRYFGQLVSMTISIYQGNIPLPTTLNLYRPLGLQMAFAPWLQNLNISRLWRSHGGIQAVLMHSAKCCWQISSLISLLLVVLTSLTAAC